jgi:hypothetical protein
MLTIRPERRKRRPSGSTTSTRGIAIAAAAAPAAPPVFLTLSSGLRENVGGKKKVVSVVCQIFVFL